MRGMREVHDRAVQGELSITWDQEMSEKIREAASAIGVTPEGLVCYAVVEVLEQAMFTRAIARTHNIKDNIDRERR